MTTQDKYVNAKRYIEALEKAKEAHQLDDDAMLEEIGRAVAHCHKEVEYHTKGVRLYTVATALYLAKAKEITLGYSWSSRHSKPGWRAWCLKHGINKTSAAELSKVGAAPDPVRALQELRDQNRERLYRRIELKTGRRPGSHQLANMKRLWWQLTTEEREAFLGWANDTQPNELVA